MGSWGWLVVVNSALRHFFFLATSTASNTPHHSLHLTRSTFWAPQFLHPTHKKHWKTLPEAKHLISILGIRFGGHGAWFWYTQCNHSSTGPSSLRSNIMKHTGENPYRVSPRIDFDDPSPPQNSTKLFQMAPSRLQRCIATINRWTDYFNNHEIIVSDYWLSQKHRKIIGPDGLEE